MNVYTVVLDNNQFWREPCSVGNTGFRETESPAIKLLGAEVTVDDV